MTKENVKDYDAAGLGDLMIDFSYAGKNDEGNSMYVRTPGGSMANVMAQVARLGGKSMLITTLGADEHSRYLYSVASKLNIDMSSVTYGTLPTRFMFVYHDGNIRYFSDYRTTRNESQTVIGNVDIDKFRRCRFFDIKSIRFPEKDPVNRTMDELKKIALENDVKLVTDMQWRGIALPEDEKNFLLEQAKCCTVLKLSDEELAFYYDASELKEGLEKVFKDSRTEIVAVTRGENGSYLATRNAYAACKAFAVPVKETTGAGDSFMGALLYALSRRNKPIPELSGEELAEIGNFCCACASYNTMFKGSLQCMAEPENVEMMKNTYGTTGEPWTEKLPEPVFIQK